MGVDLLGDVPGDGWIDCLQEDIWWGRRLWIDIIR